MFSKVKTKGGKLGETLAESNWGQEQQKALENALTKYPKNSTQDRWDKIAKCVQGKTKVCYICITFLFLHTLKISITGRMHITLQIFGRNGT